ncbi:hypothetical protein PL263_16555 [Methylomonas sp. EFPC3]|uniref:hypothetical protein n=1 Tax=Methylomonas sp. EFPC3 TaxID=3021710 RepID=UPI002417F8C9|nr:hypothetical protein [Methylomonas sp. EFPC3]WFP49699.1 hypothetical protein PL263_16555 [Methylomonas sp. EFPC3]
MDTGVFSIKSISDEKIDSLINERKSFVLEDIPRIHFGEAVKAIEKEIESKGLKCRVYTKGRSATVAAAAIPISPTVIGGWASAIGIGIHNLATWDPDYEIAKNLATGTLTVTYKK